VICAVNRSEPWETPSTTAAIGQRLNVLKSGLALAGGAALLSFADHASAASTAVNMQLGWLGGGDKIGEVAAFELGYFEQEGLDVRIQPGGPNNDGIAIIVSGRYEVARSRPARP
jgi:NitT/TauT family transport system substrate-binding protein